MQGVVLIFSNIEFRLSIETAKGVNLHLLFSPEAPDHVDRISTCLSGLTFPHQQEKFRCTRLNLIGLGRVFDTALTDEDSAYREGINQFNVSLKALNDAFNDSTQLPANYLVYSHPKARQYPAIHTVLRLMKGRRPPTTRIRLTRLQVQTWARLRVLCR